MPDFQFERALLNKGFRSIAGLDEAGRGALFGPVVAAAVIFSDSMIRSEIQGWIQDVNDSKLISPGKRRKLCKSILEHAFSVGFGLATNTEIDHKNIHLASLAAMRRAIVCMPVNPDFLLVDGFVINDVNYSQEKIIKGDRKSISIAAASIVAKVLRDDMIVHLDRIFEGYYLAKNKGYGTSEHYMALRKLGPSIFHRFTFNLKTGN